MLPSALAMLVASSPPSPVYLSRSSLAKSDFSRAASMSLSPWLMVMASVSLASMKAASAFLHPDHLVDPGVRQRADVQLDQQVPLLDAGALGNDRDDRRPALQVIADDLRVFGLQRPGFQDADGQRPLLGARTSPRWLAGSSPPRTTLSQTTTRPMATIEDGGADHLVGFLAATGVVAVVRCHISFPLVSIP